MKSRFAAAMRRASRLTRAGKPRAATRSIQRAIGSAMTGGAAASMSNMARMFPGHAQRGRTRAHRREPARSGGRDRRPMRRIIFHGDADSTVHPSNATLIVRAATGPRESARITPLSAQGRDHVRSDDILANGTVDLELWQIAGAGHAWPGGKSGGSHTDPKGPDASAEMVRFFLSKAA